VLVAHPLGPGVLADELEASGFQVVTAADAGAATVAAVSGNVDVAIVDVRFNGDGLAFCESLWRQLPGFPALVLGPHDENLVTRALTAGADDYLTLPVRPAELVARVRAVLRRAPKARCSLGPSQPPVQVGDVSLDPAKHEVWVRSKRVHLPLREFELLRALMENAGIVLARATLINRLWGPSAPEHSSSLEVHIRRLRSKIEDDPSKPQRIKTVRGVGYRYQAER
jgi:two-component system response regulator RegX3